MPVDGDALSSADLDVTVSDDGAVVRATIDRPDVRNALNDAVLAGLADTLDATNESEARVVVIRGTEGTFCSGGDLQEMDERGERTVTERREESKRLANLFEHMRNADALTVAAVERYCLAGGLGLAAGCEFVLAAEDATFGTPEVDVGMFLMQAMATITPAVGEKKALKLLFTGEYVDAAEAEDIGLVTDALDAETFDAELDEYVDRLAGSSPTMIAMGKEAYYTQRDMGVEHSSAYLTEMFTLLMESEDHAEGVRAFVEDRDPEWRAR